MGGIVMKNNSYIVSIFSFVFLLSLFLLGCNSPEKSLQPIEKPPIIKDRYTVQIVEVDYQSNQSNTNNFITEVIENKKARFPAADKSTKIYPYIFLPKNAKKINYAIGFGNSTANMQVEIMIVKQEKNEIKGNIFIAKNILVGHSGDTPVFASRHLKKEFSLKEGQWCVVGGVSSSVSTDKDKSIISKYFCFRFFLDYNP